MPDEVIQELWRVKDELAKQHHYDVNALFADLLCQQAHRQVGRKGRIHAAKARRRKGTAKA